MSCDEDCMEKIRIIVKDELSKINIGNVKKERKKSDWQIFLGTCMPNTSKELSMGEKVKECSVEWRKKTKKSNVTEK